MTDQRLTDDQIAAGLAACEKASPDWASKVEPSSAGLGATFYSCRITTPHKGDIFLSNNGPIHITEYDKDGLAEEHYRQLGWGDRIFKKQNGELPKIDADTAFAVLARTLLPAALRELAAREQQPTNEAPIDKCTSVGGGAFGWTKPTGEQQPINFAQYPVPDNMAFRKEQLPCDGSGYYGIGAHHVDDPDIEKCPGCINCQQPSASVRERARACAEEYIDYLWCEVVWQQSFADDVKNLERVTKQPLVDCILRHLSTPEQAGQPITRKEALEVSQSIMERAERERYAQPAQAVREAGKVLQRMPDDAVEAHRIYTRMGHNIDALIDECHRARAREAELEAELAKFRADASMMKAFQFQSQKSDKYMRELRDAEQRIRELEAEREQQPSASVQERAKACADEICGTLIANMDGDGFKDMQQIILRHLSTPEQAAREAERMSDSEFGFCAINCRTFNMEPPCVGGTSIEKMTNEATRARAREAELEAENEQLRYADLALERMVAMWNRLLGVSTAQRIRELEAERDALRGRIRLCVTPEVEQQAKAWRAQYAMREYKPCLLTNRWAEGGPMHMIKWIGQDPDHAPEIHTSPEAAMIAAADCVLGADWDSLAATDGTQDNAGTPA